MSPLPVKIKFPFLTLFRFLVYILLALALAEFIRFDAMNNPLASRFSEDSYTEILQTIQLFVSSGISLYIYFRSRSFNLVGILAFALTAASFFREQDVYFEYYLGQTTWMYPVIAILLWSAYVCLKHFQKFRMQLATYLGTLSSGMFISGFMTTYLFSRLFGRKIFWYAVMDEHYIRAVKNAAEECLEAYGYLILLMATVELLIISLKWNNIKPELPIREKYRVEIV